MFPFRFQAGRRRRPNLALVVCVHFLLYYILLRTHVCFSCVGFSFSVLIQEIGWENISEMIHFVSGGTGAAPEGVARGITGDAWGRGAIDAEVECRRRESSAVGATI